MRISQGAVFRATKAIDPRPHWDARQGKMVSRSVPHVIRADVVKIMRRMQQRIADKRWSGVPT